MDGLETKVAALLLLFSYDKVLGQQNISPRPIKLAKLVESLFGSDSAVFAEITERMNARWRLRRLWTNGCVFFNHFVRLSNPPTEPCFQRAFYRDAALFSPPGFKGCDIIVPVYLPAIDRFSYFLLQVKNLEKDTMPSAIKTEARDFLGAAAKLMPPTTTGHLSVMMCLRSLRNKASAIIVYPDKKNANNQKTRYAIQKKKKCKGKKKKSKYNLNDKNRVVILALGLSLKLYPGLVHLMEMSDEQPTSEASVKTLKKLLACTSEINHEETGSYRKHLEYVG